MLSKLFNRLFQVLSINAAPRQRSRRLSSSTSAVVEVLETRKMLSGVTLTVTALGDTERAGFVTLRDAIKTADASSSPDTIVFSSSLFPSGQAGTIVLSQGALPITNSMAINGPGANLLTISGNHTTNIFTVNDGSASKLSQVAINGLSLIRGQANSSNNSGTGGAIFNNEQLTLNNDVVSGSTAIAAGGGIENYGTLLVSNTTFSGNNAGTRGGAIDDNGGTIVSSGNTFSANVSNGLGGAVDVVGGSMSSTNDTFFGNVASDSGVVPFGGGGIENFAGVLTTTNDTITNNSTLGKGGGIDNAGTWNSLNTIVAGNFAKSGSAMVPSDVAGEAGSTINAHYTMIGNAASAAGIQNGVNGNIVGVPTNSIFVTDSTGKPVLASNGGPTQTVQLLHSSPAIGSGSIIDTLGSTNLAASSTTLTVTTSTFIAIGDSLMIDSEIVVVTGGTGKSWTISRGQFGTTPAMHLAGAAVKLAFDQTGANRTTNDMGSVSGTMTAPTIVSSPANQSVNVGLTAVFSASASGSPAPAIQWQLSTNAGATYTNIPGAISTTYSVVGTLNNNGYLYRAVFTNSKGTVTTAGATLTVLYAPTVIFNPTNQSQSVGLTVTFTANASGNPAPTVQWQGSTDGGVTFNNIPGATTSAYTFIVAANQNGNKFRAVFTNGVGSPATTTAATLSVLAPPVVLTNPVSQTVKAGHVVTFSATASGTLTQTVQWQLSTDAGVTFNNIPGATSNSYSFTVTVGENGDQYRAVFTNTTGTATTTAATLTVAATPPSITTSPTNQNVNVGQTATFTAAASGYPLPTATWYVSTDGGTTSSVFAGTTTTTQSVVNGVSVTLTTCSFTALTTENGYVYRALFTNASGQVVTNWATLKVLSAPVVTTNPQDQTVGMGQGVTFTVAAAGNPTPTVQWYVSTDGGSTSTKIIGAVSTSYTFAAATSQNNNQYFAKFTNSLGAVSTQMATLTVITSAPIVTLNPVSQTVSTGDTVTFTAAATGGPVPNVNWQFSNDGGVTFTNIAGATSSTYSFTAMNYQSGFEYRAMYTNLLGSATTTAATLSLNTTAPTVITNPQDVKYFPYIDSSKTIFTPFAPLQFTAAALGTPNTTVQWFVSEDGGVTFQNVNVSNVFSQTTTTRGVNNGLDDKIESALTVYPEEITQNGFMFRAAFSNSAGTATTSSGTLTVVFAPVVVKNPTDQTSTLITAPLVQNNSFSSVTFTAEAIAGEPGKAQWQVSTDGGKTFANIKGATNVTYSYTNVTGVIDTNGDFVNQIMLVTNTSYTFTPVAGQAGNQYQVIFTNSQSSSTALTATTATTPPTPGTTTPATLIMPLVPPLVTPTTPSTQYAAVGSLVTLNAVAFANPLATVTWNVSTDGGLTYAAVSGTPVTTNGPDTTSTTLSFLMPAQPTTLPYFAPKYEAIFTNTVGVVTTAPVTVDWTVMPSVQTSPPSATAGQQGQQVTFNASAIGAAAPTVVWNVSMDGGATFVPVTSILIPGQAVTTNSTIFTTITGTIYKTTTQLSFAADPTQSGYIFEAVFTNSAGTATTTPSTLSVSIAPPTIVTQPQSQTIANGS